MTPVWCMVPTMDMKRDRYGAWQTELFVILGYFLHFYFTKALKNQNFKQMKQMHEAFIILCKCTKHHDHMPYCSWDMVHDGCNFHFHFGLFFALLPPIDTKVKSNLSDAPIYLMFMCFFLRWELNMILKNTNGNLFLHFIYQSFNIV